MTTVLAGPAKAVSISEQEMASVRESGDALARFAAMDAEHLTLHLENQTTGQHIDTQVPAAAMRLFADMLSEMAAGHSVTFVSLDTELGAQQAAEMFGVSRPYFMRLLDREKIPYRDIGGQRRVLYRDLAIYIEQYQQQGTAALDEMAAEAQRLGLYE
jgi:excisionase family DNA binding protein